MAVTFIKNSDNKVIMEQNDNVYVFTPNINALKKPNNFPDHIIIKDILLGGFKIHWETVTAPAAASRDDLFDILVSAFFGSGSVVLLEIMSDNVGGEVGKSASEVVRFTVNKNATAFTGAESNNANVIINSATKISDTEVDVDLDTSAAAYEEAFSIRVIGDGETTPYYAMAVEEALAITSVVPNPALYNNSGLEDITTIYLNKLITNLTTVESNNVNIVINNIGIIYEGYIDGIEVDTTAAEEGEVFSLRVVADGKTTPYYEMAVEPPLAINNIWKNPAELNSAASPCDLTFNRPISAFSDFESNNANVVAFDDGAPYISGDTIKGLYVDTTAAGPGEIFSVRIIVDGITVDWYEMSVSLP